MGIKKPDHYSIAQYLQLEDHTETKNEYENGRILAMTGGSIAHGMLCGNIYNSLRNNLKNKKSPCTTLGSEVRIHIKIADAIVYPDTMVVCGPLQVSDEDSEAVINPVLIVEVLSKSTESYDRGDKFYKYRQLKSLKEYILIDQEKPVVESFFKQEDNVWEISRISGMDALLIIQCLDFSIKMNELYDQIAFPKR
jgi:Uma2 family endonuclease